MSLWIIEREYTDIQTHKSKIDKNEDVTKKVIKTKRQTTEYKS